MESKSKSLALVAVAFLVALVLSFASTDSMQLQGLLGNQAASDELYGDKLYGKGDVKDVCRCQCSGQGKAVYLDSSCTDPFFDYANITGKDECAAKNGQKCYGYITAGDTNDQCLARSGKLYNCEVVTVAASGE